MEDIEKESFLIALQGDCDGRANMVQNWGGRISLLRKCAARDDAKLGL